MRPHAYTSWIFMKRNLKIILRSIRSYYSSHLGLVQDYGAGAGDEDRDAT